MVSSVLRGWGLVLQAPPSPTHQSPFFVFCYRRCPPSLLVRLFLNFQMQPRHPSLLIPNATAFLWAPSPSRTCWEAWGYNTIHQALPWGPLSNLVGSSAPGS